MSGYNQYQSCIEACLKCASVCNFCASSCTKESDVQHMAECIRLDMECAVMCYTAAQLMSIGSIRVREVCKICADVCDACANECAKHDNDHCRMCAEACRQCAQECRKTSGIISSLS